MHKAIITSDTYNPLSPLRLGIAGISINCGQKDGEFVEPPQSNPISRNTEKLVDFVANQTSLVTVITAQK